MTTCRIALANLMVPVSPDAAVEDAVAAIAEAGALGARVVCFSECFIPGYRWPGVEQAPPSSDYLARALARVGEAATAAAITVIMGTERITERGLQISACVFGADGRIAGWQDKVQLDPDEEGQYPAVGEGRQVFQAGDLTFGIVICHEGWRYPETVRWAVRQGAQIVFHPYAAVAEPGSIRPTRFADPDNSFHEMAVLCRAAENKCWFASVNCASDGVPMTSAVAAPDGTLFAHQPHGQPGLLVADIDLSLATGSLAARCRTSPL